MAGEPNSRRSAETWTKAVRRALRRFEGEDGEGATQEQVVGDAYRLLGFDPPSRQQANSYFNGIEPKFRLGVALCVVLGIDPVKLAELSEPAAIKKQVAEAKRREAEEPATPHGAAAATAGGAARSRPGRGSVGRTRR